MNSEYDVIVVGVGGMGSATTYHLARRGIDVLGLERFDIPHAKGSSHGVTRIIRLPQYENPAYVPLVRRSLRLWKEMEKQSGTKLFYQTGTVDFGSPESEMIEGAQKSCEKHDIDHETLSGTATSTRFPGYTLPEDFRSVYQPDGGYLHAEQCVVAHTEAAHRHGGTVRAREQLKEWDANETGVRISTDRNEYEADRLVVTAGAWTGQLLPTLAPYLEPERQVLGWFQPTTPEKFGPKRFPVFVADVPEGHYYGLPVHQVPGFKLGKFHHRRETGTPSELDQEPTRADENILRTFAEKYFPDGTGPTMQLSTCMFTNTPDGDFIVDTHPDYANVVVGAGFSGHGFKFASVIGDVLADLATTETTEHPVDVFEMSRFE